MTEQDSSRLRVLIANERRDRLELLAQVDAGLGHDVIACEVEVRHVAAVTAREHPDVALVGLGESADHALELISETVHKAPTSGASSERPSPTAVCAWTPTQSAGWRSVSAAAYR
jgi:hypothetical protein